MTQQPRGEAVFAGEQFSVPALHGGVLQRGNGRLDGVERRVNRLRAEVLAVEAEGIFQPLQRPK